MVEIKSMYQSDSETFSVGITLDENSKKLLELMKKHKKDLYSDFYANPNKFVEIAVMRGLSIQFRELREDLENVEN